ncbi:hypothetical protein N9N95_01930 [Methylophilaceae bacterium]|nr:hypothetical protein [Methylophilaceae bacterium]
MHCENYSYCTSTQQWDTWLASNNTDALNVCSADLLSLTEEVE